MPDNEYRLEDMIQSDYQNYDSEDDVEEVKHGIRHDQQVYAEGTEQHTGDDGGYIDYALLLPEDKQNDLEQTYRDYNDGSGSGEHSGGLIRPYNKADSKHQQEYAGKKHVLTY